MWNTDKRARNVMARERARAEERRCGKASDTLSGKLCDKTFAGGCFVVVMKEFFFKGHHLAKFHWRDTSFPRSWYNP